MMPIVKRFVSYTLKDPEVTTNLLYAYKRQQPLNVDTFVDVLDNDSVSRQDRVNAELYAADDLHLINSPSVLASIWVQYELHIARREGKTIKYIQPSSITKIQETMTKHRVFISYHHANDQWAKDRLIELNKKFNFFIDESVDTGDIPEIWEEQKIRTEIRDNYLKCSTVTILLVGTETKYRKHIDWELFSSMYDGVKNKRSGIVVIMLPSTGCSSCLASFDNEKSIVFPHIDNWTEVSTRSEYESRYPFMPARIIDNLMKDGVKISVANWDELNVEKLALMIDNAANNRMNNQYDMSRRMRRRNN